MPGNLNAAQPRPIPSFESMRIGDKPLPTSFALALRQSWTQMYDLRDYLLNLFVDDEVPNGPMNGQNKTFTLANSPIPPQSLELYRNGQFLVQGTDYNLIGKTITLAVAPVSTDTLIAFYRERLSVPNQPASQPIPPAPPTGGGGGSTGGLWTQNANFLYPTATFTECVLVGAQTSDFFGGPGQVGATAAIGMMTAAANASLIYLFISPGIETQVVSNKSGTGTQLPLSFYAGGFKAVVQTTGDFIVGARTTDAATGPNVYSVGGFFGVLSASTNSHALFLSVNGTTETVVHSSFSGAGTALPLSLYVNGTRVASCTTAFNFFVGSLSITLPNAFFVGAGQNIWATDSIGVSFGTGANTSVLFMSTSPSEVVLASHVTGTGTALPLSFYVSGSRVGRFDVNGDFLVGLASTDAANGIGNIYISNFFGIVSAATNAHALFMSINGTTETVIHSSFTGTGTALPLSLYLSGVRYVTLDTSGALFVGLFTTDIAPTSGMLLVKNAIWLVSNTTNASTFELHMGSLIELISSSSGTGTILPIRINFGGTEVMRITTVGQVLVGLASSDASNNLGNIYISNFFGILSATTNAHALFLSINGTTETVIHSSFSGTGTALPLSLYTNGNRVATATTGAGFIVGTLSSDVFGSTGQLGANSSVGMYDAATNASFIRLFKFSGSMLLQSDHSGTGTNLPLEIWTGGQSTAHVRTGGSWLFGMQSSDVGDNIGWIVEQGVLSIASATTNAILLSLSINGTSETVINSNFSGSGSSKPLSLYVNAVRCWTVDNSGSGVLLGGSLTNGSYGGITGRIITLGDFIQTTGFTANESFVRVEVVSGNRATLETGSIGTGTVLPLLFKVGGEIARMVTSGQLLVGLTSVGDYSGSAGRIVVSNDVIVTTAATNSSFIRMIVTASTGELESGRTGTGTFLRMRFVTNAQEQATIDTTGRMIVGFASSDSGGAGSLMSSFTCGVISAAANAHAILMSVNGTTETVLHSTFSGTGTSLPLSLYVNGIRGMTLTVANPVHVLIGTITDDGTGALLQVHGNISVNGTVLTVP